MVVRATRGLGFSDRKGDREGRADSEFRLDTDLAAVQAGEMLDYREAQPRAADLARSRAVHSIEPLKNTVRFLRSDPLTGIGDADEMAIRHFLIGDGDAPT